MMIDFLNLEELNFMNEIEIEYLMEMIYLIDFLLK